MGRGKGRYSTDRLTFKVTQEKEEKDLSSTTEHVEKLESKEIKDISIKEQKEQTTTKGDKQSDNASGNMHQTDVDEDQEEKRGEDINGDKEASLKTESTMIHVKEKDDDEETHVTTLKKEIKINDEEKLEDVKESKKGEGSKDVNNEIDESLKREDFKTDTEKTEIITDGNVKEDKEESLKKEDVKENIKEKAFEKEECLKKEDEIITESLPKEETVQESSLKQPTLEDNEIVINEEEETFKKEDSFHRVNTVTLEMKNTEMEKDQEKKEEEQSNIAKSKELEEKDLKIEEKDIVLQKEKEIDMSKVEIITDIRIETEFKEDVKESLNAEESKEDMKKDITHEG